MNVNMLRYKLIENDMSICSLAEKTGINKSSLYRKIKGKGEVTVKEANKIAKALNLTEKEAVAIFFPFYVA